MDKINICRLSIWYNEIKVIRKLYIFSLSILCYQFVGFGYKFVGYSTHRFAVDALHSCFFLQIMLYFRLFQSIFKIIIFKLYDLPSCLIPRLV